VSASLPESIQNADGITNLGQRTKIKVDYERAPMIKIAGSQTVLGCGDIPNATTQAPSHRQEDLDVTVAGTTIPILGAIARTEKDSTVVVTLSSTPIGCDAPDHSDIMFSVHIPPAGAAPRLHMHGDRVPQITLQPRGAVARVQKGAKPSLLDAVLRFEAVGDGAPVDIRGTVHALRCD